MMIWCLTSVRCARPTVRPKPFIYHQVTCHFKFDVKKKDPFTVTSQLFKSDRHDAARATPNRNLRESEHGLSRRWWGSRKIYILATTMFLFSMPAGRFCAAGILLSWFHSLSPFVFSPLFEFFSQDFTSWILNFALRNLKEGVVIVDAQEADEVFTKI